MSRLNRILLSKPGLWVLARVLRLQDLYCFVRKFDSLYGSWHYCRRSKEPRSKLLRVLVALRAVPRVLVYGRYRGE